MLPKSWDQRTAGKLFLLVKQDSHWDHGIAADGGNVKGAPLLVLPT